MYAIFENGGKQYKACVGDLIKVEKLHGNVGDSVEFPVVMTADENGVAAGAEVSALKVTAEITGGGKDKKIIVFKYKPKKNERKKQGHRQPYTLIKVTAIGDVAEVKPTAKKTATEKKPAAKTAAAEKSAVKKAPAKKATEAKAKAE